MLMKIQKGSATVEFALIAPILLVILFGIIEFGILFYNWHMITNASREGARAGVVVRYLDGNPTRLTYAQIEAVVDEYLTNNGKSLLINSHGKSNKPVTQPPKNSCVGYGNPSNGLVVNLTYDYSFFVFHGLEHLLPGGSIDDYITLTAKTTMKCE